jgi:hypothetical protein
MTVRLSLVSPLEPLSSQPAVAFCLAAGDLMVSHAEPRTGQRVRVRSELWLERSLKSLLMSSRLSSLIITRL